MMLHMPLQLQSQKVLISGLIRDAKFTEMCCCHRRVSVNPCGDAASSGKFVSAFLYCLTAPHQKEIWSACVNFSITLLHPRDASKNIVMSE